MLVLFSYVAVALDFDIVISLRLLLLYSATVWSDRAWYYVGDNSLECSDTCAECG